MPHSKYVARRRLKSGGKYYDPGDPIPDSVIAGWRSPELWVSSGDIALYDEHGKEIARNKARIQIEAGEHKRPHDVVLEALKAAVLDDSASPERLKALAQGAGFELSPRLIVAGRIDLCAHLCPLLGLPLPQVAATPPAVLLMSEDPADVPAPKAPEAPAPSEVPAGPAPTVAAFACVDCDKSFPDKARLGSHRFRSHGVKAS